MRRKGFTLLEVVIAVAMLTIVLFGVFQVTVGTFISLQHTQKISVAKNIANYTVEYLRSRTVTGDNPLGFSVSDFGTSDETKAEHYLPGIVDLWNIPLQSNGHPRGSIDKDLISINNNPCGQGGTYSSSPYSFYYSLQGYVSLGEFDYLSYSYPSKEDANTYVCNYPTHHYHCRNVSSKNGGVYTFNHLAVRFPFTSTVNNGTDPNPKAIKMFTALPGYIPMVYTSSTKKTDRSNVLYNPFYTNDKSLERATRSYRGYRVLTTVVAHKEVSSATHVQYYDVNVTVYWKEGSNTERSYSLVSQIAVYGGS